MDIIKTFNTFFISLLRDLKQMNEEFRTIIKKHYKMVDKTSEKYIDFIKSNITKEDILNNNFEDKYIGEELNIQTIIESINENDKIIFMNYIYILYIIIILHDEPLDDELFNKTISIISSIQKKQNVKEDIDCILHDDIRDLLQLIDHPSSIPDIDNLENTTIGNLAKEIAKEIDVSGLQNLDKPEDIFKSIMDFSGENNMLGNIIKSVSTKVNEKLTSGELNQTQLFKEAMSMLETGDMMSQFFNMQNNKTSYSKNSSKRTSSLNKKFLK
jgi:hypothetical protein